MELTTIPESGAFSSILKNTDYTIHSLILSFLDLDEITAIYQIKKQYKLDYYFFQLGSLHYLLMKYANRTDRSLFFVFYQEKQFINIEKQQFNNIAANHVEQFQQLPIVFQQIFQTFKHQLSQMEQPQQVLDSLQTLLFEADLPLPKLKKQTVAMYCESTFQLFLSEIRFPNPQDVFLDPPLQSLQSYVQSSQASFFKILLQKAAMDCPNEQDKRKILTVRFCAHQITANNYKQYLIEGFQIHNMIVCIFALMQNLLNMYERLINFQRDPFMKFVEFCLRYSIYKNIITGLQEHLGFLTQSYNKLCKNAFKQFRSQPEFRFWRPMMTRWATKMKSYHGSLQQVYNYIATRQRFLNLQKFVQGQMEKLPSIYNPVYTELLKNEFMIEQRAEIYQGKEICIESFFQDNPDLYDVVGKDFLEYMLDISVNQISVHWCGSTAQKFGQNAPFLAFNHSFLKYNSWFTEAIRKIVAEKCPGTLGFTVLKEIIQTDLDYINMRLVKPCTGKRILGDFESLMKDKIESQPELQIFSEEHIQKYLPKVDFNYQDNLLAYFNNKESIPETCPYDLACFFEIMCYMEPDEILKRATKKYDENLSEPSQTDQQIYVSEDQDQASAQKVQKSGSKSTNGQ